MRAPYNLGYFSDKAWSFVLIKNGNIIYRSKKQGLLPLLFCIKHHQRDMRGAIVFDRIIGRAAAILLAYAKVKEVWTPTVSQAGKKYLAGKNIKLYYANLIISVMNRKSDDICPMEKMSGQLTEKAFIRKMLDNKK